MNPFTQLQQQITQEDYILVPNKHKHQKHSKSHWQKKSVINGVVSKEVANQSIPEKIKENQRAKHSKKTHPKKELTDGHYLDRQSGAGRLEEPRKNGGGRGNIGNLNDLLKRQIYEKETEESEQETVKVIEEVPEQENIHDKNESFQINNKDFPCLI